MTHTHPGTSSAEPVRTYPSRRDPGRGGRSRPVAAAGRTTPELVRAAAPAGPSLRAEQVRASVPALPVEPARAAEHAHVFAPVRAAEPSRTVSAMAAMAARSERSAVAATGSKRPPEHGGSRGSATRKPARKGRAPSRWAGIGVGLTVAVATTTTLTAVAPQAAAPEAADRPTTGALDAITAAASAAVDDRDGTASRSGARGAAAKTAAQVATVKSAAGGAQVTVSDKAKLSVEKLDSGQIEAPPPVLPGCDGEASGTGSNGAIPSSDMCTLWDGRTQIRADAAVALAELNEAYTAAWGEPMCITDGFRSYSQQVATKAAKGYLAAAPGTSNHGWGLAVDICPETYAGARWDWLAANAPAYGWDNPDWARPGGSKYEPWHWEWTAAVAEMGGR
ncbi:M15 family metallopeptidase [Isoptericola sp. 4D.3]|uniref:M15 family metallopeptidase n=1 Tax=Isoptericola peretonis TaxID=2918523 RepID=A0ABT0J3Q4_9MICO|nr:M15 family metallopeptidase [Isoptericola sp. 4D.3]